MWQPDSVHAPRSAGAYAAMAACDPSNPRETLHARHPGQILRAGNGVIPAKWRRPKLAEQ